MSVRQLRLLVSTTVWISACGRGSPPASVVVRDSAGVVIVTSHSPDTSKPLPSVGSAEISIGHAGSELNRVVGAVRLSDGRIVIADGGNAVIRYFSPDGILVRSVGREGDGPAEFRTLQAIGRIAGDTVWAYDFTHHRMTFFSPDARVVRAVNLRPPLPSALAVGVLPSGAIVLGESWSSARIAESSEPGLSREPVAYVRYSAAGELLDTVGLFPGREVLLSYEGGRGVMSAAPLARSAVHALSGSRLAIGDQVGHEIRLYSSDGVLERILRWDGGDLSVGPELISQWRENRLASVPLADRARAERQLEAQVVPAQRPAHGPILQAEGGGLWVADYALDGDEASMWAVFNAEGVWRGSLAVPRRFRPLDIGSGWVLGVSRDEFDVERVEFRRLEPGDQPEGHQSPKSGAW